jgi:uncharacterized membrane protein YfcA
MHIGSLTVWELTVLVCAGSAIAGLLGSLTGLGGGVVLVPLLTLFFKVDIRYAIGASLVSVIATSSGAAAAYVKEGISNIRIGMFLEIATTLGAVLGAFLAARVSTSAIAITFGAVLLYSAYLSARLRVRTKSDEIPDPLATRLRLNGSFPTPEGVRHYFVHHVPAGFGFMFGAGALSGLLGIGSGAVKVLAMDQAMRIPFKVFHHHQQFHDRRHRRCERRSVSQPGLYRSRAFHASDVRGLGRVAGGHAHSGANRN